MNQICHNGYTFTGPLEPRERKGITIIGPDFFSEDENGKLLSPIASVFPKYNTIISIRGIHAMHASMMVDFLKAKRKQSGLEDLSEDQELSVYLDAVALVIRDAFLLIRSDPENMDHVFAADEIIQSLVPKERIQFTGLHLAQVRKSLRKRGESWRMSPAPRSVQEICRYVRASRVQVGTGLTVYYNAPTGGRFLTYAECMRIRPLLREDTEEALARLREIVDLFACENTWGNRELSFFLPTGKYLDARIIEHLIPLLEHPPARDRLYEIEAVFDHFAADFAEAAGPDLMEDDPKNAVWRTTMFCRLYDINEQEMEEWALGLSPEFHLNVKWLPGAAVCDNLLEFDSGVSPRSRGLISYLWDESGGFNAINLGRVEFSQTERDITGEERDVYLVVLTLHTGQECIRLLRLLKWDVFHRLKLGQPLDQAVAETLRYRDYIFDRLHAAAELGFPILQYTEIRIEEDLPGLGRVPVFFFERKYIPGIVTDKIPLIHYGKPEFIVNLAQLLGAAAVFSLVLGRSSLNTGKIFYDDGDELIQLNQAAIPNRLVIIETTGSFADWTSPLITLLPQCLSRFRIHLEKALHAGVPFHAIELAVQGFSDALAEKTAQVKEIVESPFSAVRDLFKDRPLVPGGIRNRWEGIIARLEATDENELKDYVLNSPELHFGNRSS